MKRTALTAVVVVMIAFLTLAGFAFKKFFIDREGRGPSRGGTNQTIDLPSR